MPNRTAVLSVRVVTDASAGERGLRRTEQSVKGLGDAADKMALPVAAAAAGLALLAREAGNAASEAEQAAGGVASVFQGYANDVTRYANQAATAVGLSKTEYSNLATVIGSQLKNMGVPFDQVSEQTNDLISKGADLAAMFGGTTSDAVSALSSLLRGERDPIERYGVSINQASLDAKKAAMGISGLTGDMDRNANLQATMALLYDQTSSAAGQFGREIDSAAGSQQIANAEWQNALAILGEQLLPIMVIGATIAGDLARAIANNSEAFTFVFGVLAAGVIVLAGFIGTMKVIKAVTEAATIAQVIYNAVLTANPIGLLITLLVLLGIEIALIVTHWDEFKEAATHAADGIFGWLQPAIDRLKELWDWVVRVTSAWFQLLSGGGMGGFTMDILPWNGGGPLDTSSFARSFAVAAAPAASPQLAPTPVRSARGGSPADAVGGRGGDTYHITFTGATDKDGAAREIEKLLNSRGARSGAQPANGRIQK